MIGCCSIEASVAACERVQSKPRFFPATDSRREDVVETEDLRLLVRSGS